MSEPVFLTPVEVAEIHEDSIRKYGGTLGLRDRHGFEAAVMHPQNVYFYGAGDLFDIAAAYAFHIAEAQAFLDGNKRTAMGAAATFLDINGIRLRNERERLYDAMIGIAERRLGKRELADIFRGLAEA